MRCSRRAICRSLRSPTCFSTGLPSASGPAAGGGAGGLGDPSTAVKPLIALAYHLRYTTDPESVKALPNGEAGLASVEHVDEKIRHLSVHRGHSLDSSNGHDALVDISAAKQMTFTGTREALRERLAQLKARGATGIIFGTSGYDVERELRAYAEGDGGASRRLFVIVRRLRTEQGRQRSIFTHTRHRHPSASPQASVLQAGRTPSDAVVAALPLHERQGINGRRGGAPRRALACFSPERS